MLKKISIITSMFLLVLGLQTSAYASQKTQTSSKKIEKKVKSKSKNEKIQAKETKSKKIKKKVEDKKIVAKKDIKNNKALAEKNKNKISTVKLKQKSSKFVLNNKKEKVNYSKNLNSYAYVSNNNKQKVFNEFYNETKHIKYRMGGTGQNGIDCSAFTQKMFREKFDYALSRSTLTQVNEGIEVKKSELQPGDLVFFKTSKIDKHVGVYTGNGEFLHASIKGIQYTKLDKPFYKDSFWTARRVIN